MKVEIIDKKRVFDGFFKIDEVTLRHEKYNGEMSDKINRLNFDRGDSVSAVVYNRDRKTVLLTQQFRYPVYTKDKVCAWMLELVAGIAKNEEKFEFAIKREIEEEFGYDAKEIEYICDFFVSPGGTNERIILFYVQVNNSDKIAEGGGCKNENEDIKIIEITIEEAFQMLDRAEIIDAKTIIGLEWLRQKVIRSLGD